MKIDPTSNEPQSYDAFFDGDPLPLSPVPRRLEFPIASLPEAYASMVAAIAEATQTDPAMAGTSALGVLAACAGGRARIEIRPGWSEPLNIYTVTVAGPGERKSAVQAQMVRPIMDAEERMAADGTSLRREASTLRSIAEGEAARAEKAAMAAEGKEKERLSADAVSAALRAEMIAVPEVPRLVADDATPEAVASLLAGQGGRLAIVSAEGGIFDIIAGRYSSGIPHLDVFLKGHAGDPLKIDRKGREPEYIASPALTLALMIQPAVLSSIGRHKAFRGRGLLARFLYAEPVSKVGTRTIAPAPVGAPVREAYEQAVTEAATGLEGWRDDPAIIQLSPEAHTDVIAIETDVEKMLADGGQLASSDGLREWSSKYVGAVMRIAGLLHIGKHGAADFVRVPVDRQSILEAVRLGNYYKACAMRAFATMSRDELTSDAVYLLERIRAHGEDELTVRDAHRIAQKFKTRADLDPAIDRLIESGWLALLPEPKAGMGRPPSPRLVVHPRMFGGADTTDTTDTSTRSVSSVRSVRHTGEAS